MVVVVVVFSGGKVLGMLSQPTGRSKHQQQAVELGSSSNSSERCQSGVTVKFSRKGRKARARS